ncbi:MAG: putative nucleotidyltransferase substrate binding domain-containing protein [Permianibacter sp.]
MVQDFSFAEPPFEWLDPQQRQLLLRSLTLSYHRSGDTILKAGQPVPALFRILKGQVLAFERRSGVRQAFSEYHNGDLFGAYGLPANQAQYDYQAADDTLCYQIPRDTFLQLQQQSPAFAAWFSGALEHKRRMADQREAMPELAGLMLMRIGDAPLSHPVRLHAATSIQQATALMREQQADCLLVELGSDTGIVTRTDLLEALTLYGHTLTDPIGPITSFPLIAVDEDELLIQALLIMTRRRIERIAVSSEDGVLGTLGLTEVLSHFSSHSHVIGLQIARARDLPALRSAAAGLTLLTQTLVRHGIHMIDLGELIGAINGQLMERTFELLIPEPLQSQLCLLVLGSEGRHEQLLRTDQDNAAVFAPSLDADTSAVLQQHLQRYTDALIELGFPPCPGHIMVNNSEWLGTPAQWQQRIRQWLHTPDETARMRLAMLADARAIAGNRSLLHAIDQELGSLRGNTIALRQLASEIQGFHTPLNFFGGLRRGKRGIDIKKGGIFPLVHGLRTLALEYGVAERSSFGRATALAHKGVLSKTLADDLRQALAVLMRLRLNAQMATHEAGTVPDNHLYPEQLRHLDRELLRDALRIVDQFKDWLSQHYQL